MGKKESNEVPRCSDVWGEWWDLNPRSPGPQPGVLTPTPHPP